MDLSTSQVWLDTMSSYVQSYPIATGISIFTVAMLESLLIVGVLVPGALVMLSIGALIAIGVLDFWTTMFWAVAGAIAGDGFSFWLGYYFKDSIRRRWPFSKWDRTFEQGQRFFERHGGKSIVFGRFIGPMRAIVPTIAGMMNMSPLRFTIINVLSALAWAPAYILPGMIFGTSLDVASEVAIRLVVLFILLALLVLFINWLVRTTFKYLSPRADRILTHLFDWSRRHPILGKFTANLVDPKQPESTGLFFLAALFLAALGIFIYFVLYTFVSQRPHDNLDYTVFQFAQSLRSPWADQAMVRLTMLGDTWVTIPVSIIVLLWFSWKKNLFAAKHWAGIVIFGFFSTVLLKISLQVPRPQSTFAQTAGFSFPSNHATMAMLMYGFIAIIVTRELAPRQKITVYMIMATIVTIIAGSRLYLGAHWLSDIVGGLALGLAWVTLLGIAYCRHNPSKLPVRRFLVTFVTATVITYSLHSYFHYSSELQRYKLSRPVQVLTVPEWWNSGWRQLPEYRNNLGLHQSQPLNLQCACDLAQLTSLLKAKGWVHSSDIGLSASLHWLKPHPEISEIPILPHLHNGEYEALRMVYPGSSKTELFAIRLWKTEYQFGKDQFLYIGSVSKLTIHSRFSLLHYPATSNDFTEPLQTFKHQIEHRYWRIVPRRGAMNRETQWSGSTMLINLPRLR